MKNSIFDPEYKNDGPQLFKTPRPVLEKYSGIEGSSPKSIINTTVPPRSSDKLVSDEYPRRNLFNQPRDLNRLIDEPTYSDKYRHIPQNREPSPVSKRIFVNNREDHKAVGSSTPQINLTKPARSPCGCQSPISAVRRQLFEQPRSLFYDDVEGSHPKPLCSGTRSSPSPSTFTIPNEPKLFQNSRETMKYQDLDGSRSKNQIDLTKKERDIFYLPETKSKQLFQEPRDWTKLPSQHKARRFVHEKREEPLDEKPKLFQTPRDTMKYSDVEGSKPTKHYPKSPRQPSPTFVSNILC